MHSFLKRDPYLFPHSPECTMFLSSLYRFLKRRFPLLRSPQGRSPVPFTLSRSPQGGSSLIFPLSRTCYATSGAAFTASLLSSERFQTFLLHFSLQWSRPQTLTVFLLILSIHYTYPTSPFSLYGSEPKPFAFFTAKSPPCSVPPFSVTLAFPLLLQRSHPTKTRPLLLPGLSSFTPHDAVPWGEI